MPRFRIRDYTYGVSFNGTTSFLAKATPTGINTGTGSRYAMGWVYLTSNAIQTFVQFKVNGSNQSPAFAFGQIAGTYYYAFDTVNAGNNLTMTAAQFGNNFPLNRWIHIAYSMTSTTVSLYVNGSVVINGVSWGTPINSAAYNNLFIGKTQDIAQTNQYWFGGTMKDVIIGNGTLSATEVQENYYQGTIPSTAVDRYLMGEGEGTNIADTIGSNSLTATAITWSLNTPLGPRFAIRDYPASLNFTAATDRIDCGTDFVGTTAATISAWIYARGSGGGSNGRIFDNGRCVFFYSLSNLAIGFNSDGASSIFSASGSVQINSGWVHVVVTRTVAGVANFYINSVASGAADQASGTPGAATTNAFIGNRNAQDRNFNGRMNEVVVWNRVLTTAEISDLYFKGSVAASGLLRQFNLTTGAGTVAVDSSTNLTNGTITGATFVYDSPMKARKASVNANMVRNGDFEFAPPFTAATNTSGRFIDGTAAGSTTNDLFKWYFIRGATTFETQFDTTTKYSGTASLKMASTDTTGRGRVMTAPFEGATTASLIRQYGFPLSPNTTYTISFMGKTNNVGGSSNVALRVIPFDSSGTNLATVGNQNLTDNTDWTQYTTTFTTAATTAYGIIYFIWASAGTIGQAWADNIVLTPVYPEGRVPANGNLVKNFDFEVAPTFVAATNTASRFIDGTAGGSTTNSTYKVTVSSITASASASFDSTVSASGVNSLKLDVTDATGVISASNVINIGTTTAGIPIMPNTGYTFSCLARTLNVGTNSVFMDIRQFDATGATITTTSSNKLSGTNTTFTALSGSFTSSPNAVYACYILRNSVAGQASTAWFDDIYLAKTTNPGRVIIT